MKKEIIKLKSTSRDECLREIAEHALSKGITDNADKLFDELIKREKIGTTGFEDGITIPHARFASIKSPSVIVARSEKGIGDWEMLDSSTANTVVALLVPMESNESAASKHMDLLSTIAKTLMNETKRNIFKSGTNTQLNKLLTEIEAEVNAIGTKEEEVKKPTTELKESSTSINIVAITACTAGVAHTFMAEEALMQGANELKYNIRVETQGQKGTGTPLTEEEIRIADVVIIAADVDVKLDRFVGKRVLTTSTNAAIGDSVKVIKDSLKNYKVYDPKDSKSLQTDPSGKKGIMQHILSGVSRMIPFLVFSGIFSAIIKAIITVKHYDTSTLETQHHDLYVLTLAGTVGFNLFLGIMAGFIAESYAGRAAFAPAMIGTVITGPNPATGKTDFWYNINRKIPNVYAEHLKDGHLQKVMDAAGQPIPIVIGWSLLGVIAMAFASGAIVKLINNKLIDKLPHAIQVVTPIIFIPIFVTSIIILPVIFLLGAPVGYIINVVANGLGIAGQIDGVNFLIGFVIGAMLGWDMGGPVNKIAITITTALLPIDPRLMGAASAGTPIAPLGAGICTIVYKNLFDEETRKLGMTAAVLGFFGVSEGAIPLFVKKPKPTLIANTLSTAVASGLAFSFFVGGHVGFWGGPIVAFVLGIQATPGLIHVSIPAIFGAGGGFIAILWFFVAIGAGIAVYMVVYPILIRMDNKKKANMANAKRA